MDRSRNITIIGSMIFFLAIFIGLIFLIITVLENQDKIQVYCDNSNISYMLVCTLSEQTGSPAEEVMVVIKYAAAAEMELTDAIRLIDPSLTEAQALDILIISDNRAEED